MPSEAALDLVSRPGWRRHLNALSAALDRRAQALLLAVNNLLPAIDATRPAGGMHLWCRLPHHLDDAAIADAARHSGVTVMPGRPFYPAEASAPHLRIAFSAAANETELEVAVHRLAATATDLTVPRLKT